MVKLYFINMVYVDSNNRTDVGSTLTSPSVSFTDQIESDGIQRQAAYKIKNNNDDRVLAHTYPIFILRM